MPRLADILLVYMQTVEFEGDCINQRTLFLQIDASVEQEYHNQGDRKYARNKLNGVYNFTKKFRLNIFGLNRIT